VELQHPVRALRGVKVVQLPDGGGAVAGLAEGREVAQPQERVTGLIYRIDVERAAQCDDVVS